MKPYIILATVVVLILAPQIVATIPRHWGVDSSLQRRSRVPEVLVVSILAGFSGLRDFVGTDSYLYSKIFEQIDVSDWSGTLANSEQEVGYTVLSLIVRTLSSNTQSIFFVTAVITIVLSYWSISRLSLNPPLSLVIYLLYSQFLSPMNTVRQGLAVSIVYVGISYWNRSPRIGVLIILSASLFHVSALIALIVIYVARWFNANVKTYLLILVGGAFALRLILFDIPAVSSVISTMNPRYAEYVASSEGAGFGTYLVIMVCVAIGIVATRIDLVEPSEIWIRNLYLCSTPFMILGTRVVETARIAEYFLFALPILVPVVVFRSNMNRYLSIAVFVALGIGYYFAYLLNYGGLVPYQDVLGLFDSSGMVIHIPK